MELTFGWATEYAHQKFSVTIDETDWQQLCAESGITETLMTKVPINAKFTIMECYGRFLSEAESVRVLTGDDRTAASERASTARKQRDEMMGRLLDSLGVERVNVPAAADAPAGD